MARKPKDKKDNYKRIPEGVTKTEILLYLSDGEKKRTDIIEYIKTEQRIRTNRVIDRHLRELFDRNFLSKRGERGFPTYYYLNDDYDVLKEIFHFLKENKKETKLLKSQYFQDNINQDIFIYITRDFLKSIIKPLLEILKKDFDELEKDSNYSGMVQQIKSNDKLYQQFTKIMEERVKEISELTMEDIELNIDYWSSEDAPIPIIDIMSLFIFPFQERDDVVNILLCSPSSINFILSLHEEEATPTFLFLNAYFRYYSENIFSYIRKASEKEEGEEFWLNIVDDIGNFIDNFNRKSATPFFEVLKSHLISDIFKGKIVPTEWLGQYYLNLFVDDENMKSYIIGYNEEED